MLKKLKDYIEAKKIYSEYLKEQDKPAYEKFSKFVDIDYTIQKRLQPLKLNNQYNYEYRISFNNKIFKKENRIFLFEDFSYLDPDLKLFNGDSNLYEAFILEEKLKQNQRNKFIYSRLKNHVEFTDRYSNLALNKTILTGWTLSTYLKSIPKINMEYEKFEFFNDNCKYYERNWFVRNYIKQKLEKK